ncbi:hypothetical protein [uncultured Chitinophaga sp.]|uniref:hypothetical protein n=1 Tax=uncultured Chitinophaga sp. TaxID=339340 RepID=UPI0025F46B4F|nr:hypothetical protein [uncultured Chitinophaga sp.]
MQQELIALETLVNRHLPPHNHPSLNTTAKYVSKTADHAEEVMAALWHSMANMALTSTDDRQAAMQVQFCQRSVTTLLDTIDEKQKEETSDRHRHAMGALADKMELFLQKMEKFFPSHYSDEMALPKITRLQAGPVIICKAKELFRLLEGWGISEDFRLMMAVWVERLLSHSGDHCSRRQLRYTEEVLDVLSALSASAQTPNQRQFHEKLAEYNFNHPLYVTYCTLRMERKLGNLRSNMEKVSQLMLIRKRVSQFNYGERPGYDKTKPSLQQQLLNWLEVGILFYEMAPSSSLKEINNTDKLRINFNTGELACFLNIAVEASLIKETNNRRLLDIAARCFSASSMDTLNADTLYTLFYKNKPSILDAVKTKLQQMIYLIETKKSEGPRE